MKKVVGQITDCVEKAYDLQGMDYHDHIIVYPYGDIGIRVVEIMRNVYDIEPAFIVDMRISKYNSKILPYSALETLEEKEKYVVILASTNKKIYPELYKNAVNIVGEDRVIELESNTVKQVVELPTKIGKHSYGPICRDHRVIKSIGAFCSFANGVDVVANHEMNCITTAPFVYFGQTDEAQNRVYTDFKDRAWYLDGVSPKPCVAKIRRITIGNDVWLGKNVIVTNYANIGNGVIVGAGAIITKDVPDYAIVAGVPARIIRYRFTPDQIEMMNKIKWWDWPDETIRDRFDDFYIPVEDFIEKYRV